MKWMITILVIVLFLLPIQGMADVDESTEPAVNESAAENVVEPTQEEASAVEDSTEIVPEDFAIPEEITGGEETTEPFSEDVTIPEEDTFSEDNQFAGEEFPDEIMDSGFPEEAMPPDEGQPSIPNRPGVATDQEMEKMNKEYQQLGQTRATLDQEFQTLEAERQKLIEEKDGLKKKEEILDYNKRTEELNQKIQQYEEKWNNYNAEVQGFNTRVKEDIEKRISAVNQDNIDTNYESFSNQYEESFDAIGSNRHLALDEEAPQEEQRAIILKYKEDMAKENQELIKERDAVNKEKKLVKTAEEIEALNSRTTILNEKIIKHGERRASFDIELKKFNERLEKKE